MQQAADTLYEAWRWMPLAFLFDVVAFHVFVAIERRRSA